MERSIHHGLRDYTPARRRREMLGFVLMPRSDFDLAAAAHQEMIDHGFDPDFPPEVDKQVAALATRPTAPVNPVEPDIVSKASSAPALRVW